MNISRNRNTKAATTSATHTPPIRLRGTFPPAPGRWLSGWPEPPGLVVVTSGPGGSGWLRVAVITTAASHLFDGLLSINPGWRPLCADVAVNGARRRAGPG